jgi:hypothetical protein
MHNFHVPRHQGILSTIQKRAAMFQLPTRVHLLPKPYIPRPHFSTANPSSPQRPTTTISHQGQSPEFPPVCSPTGLLTNKKALITGASRGIGAAIAVRFAHEGVRCVLVGRNTAKLQEVKDSLAGEGHSLLVGDVGSAEFWGRVRREEVRYFLSNLRGDLADSGR